MMIEKGLCECGCGLQTKIILESHPSRGLVKGQYRRFIAGHCGRSQNGGRHIDHQGYIRVLARTHPRANRKGFFFEHILVAEAVLGKFLPEGAVVHHADENRANNKNSNLVICQDGNYHKLLHRRLRARKACGNANYRKCFVCQRYDDPSRMTGNIGHAYHSECRNEYYRNAYAKRAHEQNKKSHHHYITWQGITLTLTEWTEKLGYRRTVLPTRLKRGWPIERAFTTPVQEKRTTKVNAHE